MDFPVLVAQTPRAGVWHHLTLLPAGGLPEGCRADDYLGAAAAAADGGNYLAAVAGVTQPATGRRGREILALVGLDVASVRDAGGLRRWLADRLRDLGGWVEAYDWDSHPGGVGRVPALDGWRDEAVMNFGPRPHPTENRVPLAAGAGVGFHPRLPRPAVVLAALGLAGAVWAVVARPSTRPDPPGPGVPTPTDAGRPTTAAPPGWDELLDEYLGNADGRGKKEDELVEATARALQPDVKGAKVPATEGFERRWPAGELRDWVWNHAAFREWVVRAYPSDQRKDDWVYLVPPAVAVRRRIEAVTGGVRTVAELRAATRRWVEFREFLSGCAALKPTDADLAPEELRRANPLIGWHHALVKSKSRKVPGETLFWTPDAVDSYAGVAGQLAELDTALRAERVDGDKDTRLYPHEEFCFGPDGRGKLAATRFASELRKVERPDAGEPAQRAVLPFAYRDNDKSRQTVLTLLHRLARLCATWGDPGGG